MAYTSTIRAIYNSEVSYVTVEQASKHPAGKKTPSGRVEAVGLVVHYVRLPEF